MRHEVAESWARSLTSVDPGRDSAPVAEGGPVHERWSRSPLRRPVDDLADELRSVADDAGFVTAVTDESGTILWTYGGQTMRRRAERVNFAPGGRWDEQTRGTNALSLALRTGRPSTVFSAEHLVTALHGWACYCAPIHGPDGQVLGVLDLSTTWDRSPPLAMSTVRGLASAIEAELRTEPPLRSREDQPQARLHCLGTEKAVREGVPLLPRPRHLEMLTLLALEPDGYTRGKAPRGPVRRPCRHRLHVQGGDLPSAPGPRGRYRHAPLRTPPYRVDKCLEHTVVCAEVDLA
ncbi:GAF domain-containing protein [Streptomyces sp. DSM 40750]|uniref:GAF domain-containing protein n=1 Tax=Streptomyces sp. DSM 40750 TaxID=2801030 RepID=UPI00214C849C|nr:GAF domain-containing protein [Streptomyces sp. DSM 40750]UUU19002.1 hypothetical protein JIX55_00810 [Streptomyces sp. DSM 40750]UUU27656.1 hypothetical protein JIX55_49940 [Streptomyces sp. DSM 40750]